MASDHGSSNDAAAFERHLLASARVDAPPDDAQAAWTRFARAFTVADVVHQPAHGLRSPRATIPVAAADLLPIARVARPASTTAIAVKWLLLGALGGSAVTAAIGVERRGAMSAPFVWTAERMPPGSPAAPTRPVTRGAGAPSQTGDRENAGEAKSASLDRAQAKVAARAGAATRPRHEQWRTIRHRRESQEGPVVDAPTLSAEVARIDAARDAIASGDYDLAQTVVARYHRDFPNGALAPDADVVALEAAAAQEDRAEVARRAAAFLARYPGDPHAAHVKRLAGR